MRTMFVFVWATALAAGLAGCAGNQSLGLRTIVQPMPEFTLEFKLPPKTIGEELPGEGVGSTKDPTWGSVGGFTQSSKAQVLAFPPNTVVTLRNLSKTTPHTLDVIAMADKPPAHFPNKSLPFPAHGNGILGIGYASGSLNPGTSVKIKLSKPGTYLIGCAYHYSLGMRDVIRVVPGATPGPLQR